MKIRAYLCGHGIVMNGETNIDHCPECVEKSNARALVEKSKSVGKVGKPAQKKRKGPGLRGGGGE